MEIGLGLPNGGATVMTEDLVRLATGAEAAGLDATWTLERWLRPQRAVDVPRVPVPVELPADAYACVFHPLDLLAHLAALTRRVRLGTSAVLALLHPPVLLAHGSSTGCIPTEAISTSSRPTSPSSARLPPRPGATLPRAPDRPAR